MNLHGVAAIVTGGASGLGAATARLLAEQGAKVTVFDLDEQTGGAEVSTKQRSKPCRHVATSTAKHSERPFAASGRGRRTRPLGSNLSPWSHLDAGE